MNSASDLLCAAVSHSDHTLPTLINLFSACVQRGPCLESRFLYNYNAQAGAWSWSLHPDPGTFLQSDISVSKQTIYTVNYIGQLAGMKCEGINWTAREHMISFTLTITKQKHSLTLQYLNLECSSFRVLLDLQIKMVYLSHCTMYTIVFFDTVQGW